MELKKEFEEMVNALTQRNAGIHGLVEALRDTPASVSVRINGDKAPGLWNECRPVPWCSNGRYLSSRPSFTLDPALHAGAYYVQDASSMYIAALIQSLNLTEPVACLDACAAPGGKSTALMQSLPAGSLVVANEYDYRRAEILCENITKWGTPGFMVTRGDTARFTSLKATFDIIAADVPCSGEGMMRKDADAAAQWSPRLIEECTRRQRSIIDNLWPALKPGGYLIYSTCTFNLDENEHMVQYIMDTHGAESVMMPCYDNLLPSLVDGIEARRFMPHRIDGEGLFVALLRKPGEPQPTKESSPKRKQHKEPQSSRYMPAGMKPLAVDNVNYAILPQWEVVTKKIMAATDCIMPGLEVSLTKGHDEIPSHALALSTAAGKPAFPVIELNTPTALEYLRRNTIQLPGDAPRGYIIVTHESLPLGWVKNIGNRCNNLYPRQWRILK